VSENERKALKTIVMLQSYTIQGHFKIYSEEIQVHLEKLVKLYRNLPVGDAEYKKMNRDILAKDEIIGTAGYESNYSMMFSIVIELVEEFAIHCKGERGEAWRGLYEYARKNDFHKHLSKKQMLKQEIDSLDKGIEIANIIKEEKQ